MEQGQTSHRSLSLIVRSGCRLRRWFSASVTIGNDSQVIAHSSPHPATMPSISAFCTIYDLIEQGIIKTSDKQKIPKQLSNELSKVDSLFGDKVKREFSPIPKEGGAGLGQSRI